MNNMKPREKALLAITVLAMVIYVAWSFGLEEAIDSLAGGDVAVLAAEQDFATNLQSLSRKGEIERSFINIEQGRDAGNPDIRPALAFQQDVGEICRKLGFNIRSIKADVEEIEGVEDYELINVALRTDGQFDQTVRLLKEFHKSNMLFREMEMATSIDRDVVETRITVARITEVPKRAGPRGLSRF